MDDPTHLPVVFDPVMLTDATPTIGRPIWAKLPEAEALGAADEKKALTEE